uniref:BSD domain-containing protein n=1 Tax=Fagus sylvatica TaxID=28930 RepID=A0A2N9EUQ4_FAGSY
MEDIWKRAKSLAEEAARRSQTLTNSVNISDLVSETTKKSKELAAEASKKADQIKSAALDQIQIQQIKSLSLSDIIPSQLSSLSLPSANSDSVSYSPSELRIFGVTDDLRDFVKGLTSTTFQNFPIKEEAEASDVSTTSSNVRKDLNEWQEKHATIVLTSVKEISRLRYELCPRIMKERRFWRIYFTLVSSHVAPFEKQYMEELKLKAADQIKDAKQTSGENEKAEGMEKNSKGKTSNSSSAEQDLDKFLLGDLEDSDGGADDGEESFDDDFDKIDNSDVEDETHMKKAAAASG